MAERYSIAWMYQSLFIHSPVEGYLASFQFGIILNRAAINIHTQIVV